ncbi:hypothetical protein BJX99DRAFT_255132 [Aspergillus californicus]
MGKMLQLPHTVISTGDGSKEASFCFVNGAAKHLIKAALARGAFTCFIPTFIRVNWAEKALSSMSVAPCLGLVFFYGNLTNPEFLMDKLELSTTPKFRSATVEGGAMRTWGHKYKALVDGHGSVDGWAYEVASAEHEGVLRYHETDRHEVVRCTIFMCDSREHILGLTFQYVGGCDPD